MSSKLALIRSAVIILSLLVSVASVSARGPVSVSDLAGELSDAVVNIGATHSFGDMGEPFPELPPGSALEDLFDELNPNNGDGEEAMREARSLGSGFIIDATGIIVTNNHVIEGASEIMVFLTDGRRLEARVLGSDDKTDLAVLKVDSKTPLPFVEFGDSTTAEVGDWVMAIGNPFGLGGSVTLGIVSARNRNIDSGPYDSFIQTDAAINQGNSGGPLFDMDGKVVGINTAIISRTGGGLGIGFAVPANLAAPVVAQLAEFGETRRGWLGVGIQNVSEDIAASLGRDNTHGAMVVDLTPEGPSVGVLEEGDVILSFDGKPIVEMRDLPRIVAETAVGKRVSVHVLRAGKELDFDITLGRLEDGEVLMANNVAPEIVEEDPAAVDIPLLSELVGLEAQTLTDEWRLEYDLGDDVTGVVISAVRPGSDAADKGMLPGLVIKEVNQQPISTVDDVSRLVSSAAEAGRPAVLFKVSDLDGQNRFIAVRLN